MGKEIFRHGAVHPAGADIDVHLDVFHEIFIIRAAMCIPKLLEFLE